MPWLAVAMICSAALAVHLLGTLAYRAAEVSILLVGLIAILGVGAAAVFLLADALARPLVAMADAVQALARERSAGPRGGIESRPPADLAAGRCTTGKAVLVAAVELTNGAIDASDGPTATDSSFAEQLRRRAAAGAIGTVVDIVIPCDRRSSPDSRHGTSDS